MINAFEFEELVNNIKSKLSKSEIYIFNNNYYLELLCDEYYKIEEFYDDIIYKNIKNIVKNSD